MTRPADGGVSHRWRPRWKKRIGRRLVCVVCQQTISFWNGFEKCQECKCIAHAACIPNAPCNCTYSIRKMKHMITQAVCESNQNRWSPSPLQKCQSEPPTTPINSSINLSSSGYCTSATNTPIEKHSTRISKTADGLDAERLMAPRNVFFGSDEWMEHDFEGAAVPGGSGERAAVAEAPACVPNAQPFVQSQQSTTSESSSSMDHDGHRPQKQSSVTAWEDQLIPLENIKFGRLIGLGHFGQVYTANYFGRAAVRFAPMQFTNAPDRLTAFKRLYDCYRTARHENLVFFCGYTVDEIHCHYGIVTEYFTGPSLYSFLHQQSQSAFIQAPDISEYAVHICQAMSYLHSKGIVHRDLRSKNVFVQGNRAVVSDYAIFDFYQLQRSSINKIVQLPDEWLAYMAPEMHRNLSLDLEHVLTAVEFTNETDMFAFGTVWYELLTLQFPQFDRATTPQDIHRLVHSLGVRECWKVFLSTCWQFDPSNRWSFARALDFLRDVPQMGLKRTASLRM
ncbi:hypothetical protein M3Y99_00146100 [Aphelenchoides fujianensis]|nr:hypothetical protein M3Y99_00146100 [Aphelenchoides fujianensis]